MSACCNGAASGREPRTPLGRAGKSFAWLLPSATLVLMPKCPVCLAAYLAMWTGVGLSLPAAAYVRWTLLTLSAATLLCLALGRLPRLRAVFNYFTKENETCNTKS